MITTKTAKELYEISDYIDRLENRFHQAAGWNPKEVSFTLTVVEKKDHEPNYEVDIDLGGHMFVKIASTATNPPRLHEGEAARQISKTLPGGGRIGVFPFTVDAEAQNFA